MAGSSLITQSWCWSGKLAFNPKPKVSNYGWEWQIAETTLLALFVAPWSSLHLRVPPTLAVWLVRWLAFRVMWGAGTLLPLPIGCHAEGDFSQGISSGVQLGACLLSQQLSSFSLPTKRHEQAGPTRVRVLALA